MQLPNAQNAIVNLEKIRDYCLNSEHARGKHKARVFFAALGYTQSDALSLQHEIRERIPLVQNCEEGEVDEYGKRYLADIEIRNGAATAIVRTAWIVKRGENQPRLTTCYVKQ